MPLQVLTWSVQKKPLGIAFRNLWSCSSSSCPYFSIQCLNSLFHVWYVLRLPPQFGTVNRSRLLGFVPIATAIFSTAEVIVFKVSVWSGPFGRAFSLWYAANFKVIWRKSALTLSPSFRFVNTNSSSDEAPSSINLSKIVSCCFLTDLYFDSTKLNTASSLSSPGFTAKIALNSSINSLRIPTALFIFPVRVFTSTFGGIAKWRCKLKYFLEQSVARFMAVGCSGKWCVSLVNLNDCNDSKIGRSLVSLSVVLGDRSFYHHALLYHDVLRYFIYLTCS